MSSEGPAVRGSGLRSFAEARLTRLMGPKLSAEIGDLFVAQAVPLVGMVLLHLLTAAALGPAGKGQASFMVMTGGLGASILFCSLHVGALTAVRAGDRSAAFRGLLASTGLGFVPLVIAGAILSMDRFTGPALLGAGDVALMLAGTGLAVVALYLLRTIQGLGLARTFRRLTLLQAYTYFAATGIGLLIGLTPTMVIAAWTLGQGVSLVAAVRVLLRELPPDGSGPRVPMFRPALAAHMGNLGHQLMYRSDVVVLGVLATQAEVGVYAMAIAVAEPVLIVAEAFSLATFAEGKTGLSVDERRERLTHHIKVYRKVAAVGALALAAAAWVLFEVVLGGFERSLPLLLILLPGLYMGGVGRIRLSAVIAADDRATARLAGAASVAGCVAYFPMIHFFGAYGAAVASSAVYALHAVLLGYWMNRRG